MYFCPGVLLQQSSNFDNRAFGYIRANHDNCDDSTHPCADADTGPDCHTETVPRANT
jgi:hypothetical protein